MALTSYKVVHAANAAALVALVTTEIAAGNSPVGAPVAVLAKEYPAKWDIYQSIAVGVATVTNYGVIQASNAADLAEAVTAAIGGGSALLGGALVLQPPQSLSRAHLTFLQATFKGTAADAGMGGGGGGGGPIGIADVTGLTAALAGKVATTVTVNGHALSANVTVSASDLTTGTVPAARLPLASAGAVGVVKQGSGCTVAGDGTLSVP